MSAVKWTYHTILTADSRATGFTELDTHKLYSYVPHYIAKPGAKISDLAEDTIDLLNEIPRENTSIILKIAAGINNLNAKVKRSRAYEIAPTPVEPEDILEELNALKSKIIEARPDAIVSYITIAPVNYLQQLKYWQDKHRLPYPIYSETDRLKYQKEHEDKIIEINKRIKDHNQEEQYPIKCQTSSWHSNVLRLQKGKYRLVVRALYDGIHATTEVKKKWHRNFHQSVQREIQQLQALKIRDQ